LGVATRLAEQGEIGCLVLFLSGTHDFPQREKSCSAARPRSHQLVFNKLMNHARSACATPCEKQAKPAAYMNETDTF